MVTPNQPSGTPGAAKGRGLPTIIQRVAAFIADPETENFEDLALDVISYQKEHNPAFGALFSREQSSGLSHWSEVPWVPTEAFRSFKLSTAPEQRVFLTSGTSGSSSGKHYLPDTGLYDLAWKEPFRRHLLPDRQTMSVLSLIPDETEAPQSSLSYMVSRILNVFGEASSGVFVQQQELQAERLEKKLRDHIEHNLPALILGTAFSMVHFLDYLGERRLQLPVGSRIMDTGGFKGRSRELERDQLLNLYEQTLGIPETHVVGEYGMTELCSQYYEATLVRHQQSKDPKRIYVAPHWVRTQILNPETLQPQPKGHRGLVAHFDLANAWTVSSVLTGDLGVLVEDGFLVFGRAPGTELRGCSLSSEFLELKHDTP
ncbi:MAG: hypothetical protein HKN21_06135 [Candidatus Eisenbacteria bacterium]|uniref:Acyl-protein synthetase LuxE domain-containing protein n=1 Tax=Eiseniibacteriota bacterium TaxID=2212470 RepID=A0A7Y2H1R9_UNCEI|nr:hypothetical protein [Candidatus Eisenbacteria bacterium]